VLRTADQDDVDSIRRWRNHPEVRRQFIHRGEISERHHQAWWRRVADDPAAQVLIFEDAGGRCGVVTISHHDRTQGTAEWGFYLDVVGLRARGALFGAWIALEREAIRYAFDDLGLAVLGGRTLATNAAVLELHRRSGFTVVPEKGYTAEIGGQECAVVWMEMSRGGGSGWRSARAEILVVN